ncbi:unnamed protein product [Schistosoma margrebowiei]|uniref:Uncharacterized protein n=1 Tax=Schistosoma margrebowiei TaxID=48269 RepID=A0A183LTN1_9TREM|nr:unnamed protein product [Schistosoma margrebowiei]
MRRYNPEVLGISETHWTQIGQKRLTSGELLLYRESHGPRIIKASFKTKKEAFQGTSSNAMRLPTNTMKTLKINSKLAAVDHQEVPNKASDILMAVVNAKTNSQLYGPLWNNQLNGIHHSTSTSLTTKRNLIAWTEQHYGNLSTLLRASEDSQYHTEFI